MSSTTTIPLPRRELKALLFLLSVDAALTVFISPTFLNLVLNDSSGIPFGNWRYVFGFSMLGLVAPVILALWMGIARKSPLSQSTFVTVVATNIVILWATLQFLADKLGRLGQL